MPAPIFFLRISLRGIDSVWRGITVPATVRLSALHQVLQATMGWHDCHLHEFTARNGERFGVPEHDDFDPPEDEKLHKLEEFLDKPRDKLRYTYDFGDSWEHVIELKLVAEYPKRPTRAEFIDGAGNCPPEDCGGVPGYYEMLKAIHNPTHPEHRQFVDWLPNGTYDPDEFDPERVKLLLRSIRV
jgi:hypothetical protein